MGLSSPYSTFKGGYPQMNGLFHGKCHLWMDDWGLALWRNGNPQSWCVLQKFGDKKRENTYLEKLRSLRTKECRSAFIHWISNVWSDPAIVQPSCIFEDSKKYPCVSWQQCLMQGGSNSDTGTVILLCVFWKIFFFMSAAVTEFLCTAVHCGAD